MREVASYNFEIHGDMSGRCICDTEGGYSEFVDWLDICTVDGGGTFGSKTNLLALPLCLSTSCVLLEPCREIKNCCQLGRFPACGGPWRELGSALLKLAQSPIAGHTKPGLLKIDFSADFPGRYLSGFVWRLFKEART